MAIVTAPARDRMVIGGVDTHADVHVVAALDSVGVLAGVAEFGTDAAGLTKLVEWLSEFGDVARVGVEGTGSYGAGLARELRAEGIEVSEVDRPNRQLRRRKGKSDSVDAVAAARTALASDGGQAKSRDGNVEAIRTLLVAKRSARRQRTAVLTQMRHLVYTAPQELRDRFVGIPHKQLVGNAASLRPDTTSDPVTHATKAAMRELARRVQGLAAELARLDELLEPLVTATAPALLARPGVGIDTAASLLSTAGDNPNRLHSEAAWAHLCGVAPIEASSGKVSRHRLDRGGDRQANSALWRIVMVRMSSDPRTRAYVARRTDEGRSTKEIMRCLKRYVARELYRYLPP